MRESCNFSFEVFPGSRVQNGPDISISLNLRLGQLDFLSNVEAMST